MIVEMSKKNKDFVTKYFAWLSLSEQKNRAKELQNITKESEKERKNEKNEEESEK